MDFDIYSFFIQKGFSDSSAALLNLVKIFYLNPQNITFLAC